MEERLALIASSLPELIDGLEAYLQSAEEGEAPATSVPVFTGSREKDYPAMKELLSGKAGEAMLRRFLKEKKLDKLAAYWVKGFHVPWESLHEGERVEKISLPTYPFEKRRCWFEPPDGAGEMRPTEAPEAAAAQEHVDVPGEGEKVGSWLRRVILSLLNLSEDDIGSNKELRKYGFDSLTGMRLINRIKKTYNINISPKNLSQYNTIEALTRHLMETIDPNNSERENDMARINENSEDHIDLDDLSESEVDQLLTRYMNKEQI